MIIKSKDLLLFNPDALRVEYLSGLKYSYYIVADKNNKKYIIQGYQNEGTARKNLDNLSKIYESGKSVIEI